MTVEASTWSGIERCLPARLSKASTGSLPMLFLNSWMDRTSVTSTCAILHCELSRAFSLSPTFLSRAWTV